ncbi:MAG: porin [Verrucomicrobiae bacterium]|nr:porin [Verrucomicrobiae bacterium]MDW7979277.1 outer membrane beta-barrel protein [Verrucomicrobiales bacterium]
MTNRLNTAVAVVFAACGVPLATGADTVSTEVTNSESAELVTGAGSAQQSSQGWVKSLTGDLNVSGFVSVSFFHNFNDADPSANAFVTKADEFILHKLKLAIEKPVARSGEKWDVGLRADVIAGEDAKVIHAAGLGTPDDAIDLEQAYLSINVPVGTGLKVALGKMVTLMGVEVIEETLNPNWTVGNQFLYVENFTQLGGLIAYNLSDSVEAMVAVFNGWDKVNDNNDGLSAMGKVNLALRPGTSVALLGYAGPEQDDETTNLRKGAQLILTQTVGSKLTFYAQADYGHEDEAALAGGDAEWWAGGIWAVYNFVDEFGVALRADHLIDSGSSRTGFDASGDTALSSLTLTLNIKPIPDLHIRPEVRWDHCSEPAFADGNRAKRNQVLLGMGVSYVF